MNFLYMLLLWFFRFFRTEALWKTRELLAYASWQASSRCNWRHIFPWIKVFCLEIHFLLYFFAHLIFFSEIVPFMVSLFFKKKYLIVWEEVCCGLGVAKQVVALQIFMHWNNHILFYGKPFCFSHKNSREFATSVFLKSGSHRTINFRLLGPKGHILLKGLFPWVQRFCDRVLIISSHRPLLGQPLTCWRKARTECHLEKRRNQQVEVSFIVQPYSGEQALRCWWKFKREGNF